MNEKNKKANDPIPARIFALIPTDGHNAIIICRFNSKKTGVFGWDLLTNKITLSQWLKSRIHEYFSDITPDGKHFIYTSNDKGWGYTAISKTPWIKAISFWWDGGFRGGGFFIDNKRYLLNNGKVGYLEEKEDWEWCEYRYDNIYYAKKGCLYELSSTDRESKLIYDCNQEKFEERIAPY